MLYCIENNKRYKQLYIELYVHIVLPCVTSHIFVPLHYIKGTFVVPSIVSYWPFIYRHVTLNTEKKM